MAVENRGPQLIGVNVLFLTLAVIATTLRCYVRIKMVKAFGLDDWLMVGAAVCLPMVSKSLPSNGRAN